MTLKQKKQKNKTRVANDFSRVPREGRWSGEGVGEGRGEGGVSRPTWGSPAQLGDRQGVPPGPSLGTLGVSLGTLGGSLGTPVFFCCLGSSRVVEGRQTPRKKSSHRSALAYFTHWAFFLLHMYVCNVCVCVFYMRLPQLRPCCAVFRP